MPRQGSWERKVWEDLDGLTTEGGVQVEVTNTPDVNVANTPNVNVANTSLDVNVINPENPSPQTFDAFGRLRVATPNSLFDSQLQYDAQPLLWVTKSVGTSSQTHVPAESCVNMTIGTASGDHTIRQTREYFRYQPGKSQFAKCTGVLGSPQAGTEKLLGYGDDANGVFFGQDGGGVFLLLRSSSSGSVNDGRKVYQADWNRDKMDGTGDSGVTLDPTKTQIFLSDLQWLGVGRVRMGLIWEGSIIYVHDFVNANVQATTYMTTANLPIRYEIKNTTNVASSSTLKHICSEVESEGGQQDTVAYPFSAVRQEVIIPEGYANRIVIFAARNRLLFNGIENRAKFIPTTYDVMATGQGRIASHAVYNITPTGTPTWANYDTDFSIMEVSTDIGANFSNGQQLDGSVVAGGGKNKTGVGGSASIASRLPFGLDIDGANPVVMCVVAWAIGSTMEGDFTMNWEEIR